MKIIIVGEENEELKQFAEKAGAMSFASIERILTDWEEALRYAETHAVDMAVIHAGSAETDSLELGRRLHELDPYMLLLYVTEQEATIVEALRLRASILLRPYTQDDLVYAFESLHLLSKRKPKRIYARTFGYFDLFLDGKPVMFRSAKAKELLALLIDRRGGAVDSDQIISVLWNDRPKDVSTQSLCSKLCKTLQKELHAYGIDDLLITTRSSRSINLDVIGCDLYDILDGDEEVKKQYYGEYMTDYEWAEYRNYSLTKFI